MFWWFGVSKRIYGKVLKGALESESRTWFRNMLFQIQKCTRIKLSFIEQLNKKEVLGFYLSLSTANMLKLAKEVEIPSLAQACDNKKKDKELCVYNKC